jgi:hypothetical protein
MHYNKARLDFEIPSIIFYYPGNITDLQGIYATKGPDKRLIGT